MRCNTIPGDVDRLRNAGARVGQRRAKYAARKRCPDIVAPLEQAVFFVENGKEAVVARNPLRHPEEQIAARPQGVVECSH